MKRDRGITLIALAITIAVLMILASVAIRTLTAEDGLLSETRRGIQQQEELTKNEEDYFEELQGASSTDFLGE